MIKLNNKNITYVALADSSNSIKAPKEIWYADTNNSVKLVYRRKDALIEGEDYEKYHWLKGDGTARMRCTIECNSVEWKLKGSGAASLDAHLYNEDGKAFQIVSDLQWIGGSGKIGIYDNALTQYFSTTKLPINTIRFVMDTNVGSISINDTDFTNPDYTISRYFELANQLRDKNSANVTYSMSEVKIDDVKRYIPCKLLKPVPKWLDANGIRRQVGECGMIDLVSGKFYGNVNSNGTFTVENYYERKEWLQGRNGAYINTMHPLTTYDDAFYVKAHFDGTIRNPNNEEQNIFGYTHLNNNAITDICRLYINSSGRISCNYYIPDGNWDSLPNSLGLTDIEVYSYAVGNNHYVNLNDTLHTLSTNGMQQQTFGSFIALFSNNGDDDNGARLKSRYFHGDIASFRISDPTFTTDKMNLIPCTLTMDLPASMDANGISRTKGTSGMWDLVSDRFYGNVANSGMFKAVNLAEGVDYEVHQWLKVQTTTQTGTYLTLSLGTSMNFSFKRVWLSDFLNTWYFRTPGYVYYTDNHRLVIVWDFTNLTTVDSGDTSTINVGDIITIESTPNLLLINGKTINQYNYVSGAVSLTNAVAREITSLTSSITVDGIERYIPVKLLRSIPSKYDANGIARQAGECGMYDTVNDKFYGNVASSGTFTVSDDS